jgi:hypothetical protein
MALLLTANYHDFHQHTHYYSQLIFVVLGKAQKRAHTHYEPRVSHDRSLGLMMFKRQ